MKISSDQKPKQSQHLHWAKWWSPCIMLCWTTFHFYSKTHPGTELKFKSVIRKCPFLLRTRWFPINVHVDLFNIQYIFQTLPIHILWDIELTLIALKWNLPNCVSLCPDCVCVCVYPSQAPFHPMHLLSALAVLALILLPYESPSDQQAQSNATELMSTMQYVYLAHSHRPNDCCYAASHRDILFMSHRCLSILTTHCLLCWVIIIWIQTSHTHTRAGTQATYPPPTRLPGQLSQAYPLKIDIRKKLIESQAWFLSQRGRSVEKSDEHFNICRLYLSLLCRKCVSLRPHTVSSEEPASSRHILYHAGNNLHITHVWWTTSDAKVPKRVD
jgi:hypothetical protein